PEARGQPVTATRALQRGYLVIADIAGYTSYLTRTELEHAHGIVDELTQLVIARLGAPLRFVELEGDAVFAYAPVAAFADAERLLDMIEGCYVAFRLRLEEMRRATTCTCSACALIGALDLKFVAHLGSFVLQQSPTGPKPIGPDVILVHRLLKNGVAEALGTKAYALLTDTLLARAGGTLGLPAHREHYDDLGEVRGRVADLTQAVARHREARIFVARGEGDLELVTPLPVPRAVAWEYHIDPRKRMRWQLDAREIEAKPNAAGRAGVGWESHCDHGAYTLVHRAVDWRPFDYLTLETTPITRGPLALPRSLSTFEFIEDGPDRSVVAMNVRALDRGLLSRITIPLAALVIRRQFRAHYAVLSRVLEEGRQAWAVGAG
ncbi:MAG: DUF2652 domain-containing protein, partial [Candidatus Rokuibacteriota bacterium]